MSENNSISSIQKKYSQEGSDQDHDAMENVDQKHEVLKKQKVPVKSQISELKGRVTRSGEGIPEKKDSIRDLKEEIIQKRKGLEEMESQNRQSEEQLSPLHSKLLEAEGSYHFISEVMEQQIREMRKRKTSSKMQSSDDGLNADKKQSEAEPDRMVEEKSSDLEFNHLKMKAEPEAKEEAMALMKEARLEAENRINKAEEEAGRKTEEAERQAQEILSQARQQVDDDLAVVEEKLEKRKVKVNAEIQKFYSEMNRDKERLEEELKTMNEEARRKMDLELKGLKVELEEEMEARAESRMKEVEEAAESRMKEVEEAAESRMKEVEEEAGIRMKEIDEKIEITMKEARLEAENRISKAEEGAACKTEEAERQAQEILERARKRIDNLVMGEKNIEKQKKEMNAEVKNLHSQMKADKKKSEQELKRMKQEAEKEVILDSEKLRFELEAQTKADADKKFEELRKQAREIISRAHQQADDHISVAEQEIDKRKRQVDDEIQDIRSRTIKKFQDQRRALEEEEKRRNELKAMRLKKELNEVLRVRIRSYLKDGDHLDRVFSIIDKTINVIALGKMDDIFIEDEYDTQPHFYEKEARKFWLVSGLSALAVVMFFLFLPTFRKMAFETGRNIATEEAMETRQKITNARARNDFSKEFRPDKVDKFFGTYTDRVLYTRDYVAIELFGKYRQKWILELQNYFTEKLKLSENSLVPFIAQESNLIRELDEAMKKINGHFVGNGIARMRNIEKGFEKKLQAQLKKKSHYKKVMAFKKVFFEKNANQFRKQASLSGKSQPDQPL